MPFDIDVRRRLGEREITCRIAGPERATTLFGPSGAGKTSVLNMVAGLLRPDSGHIRIGPATLFDAAGGVNVPAHRRRAGYVFQDPRLFPHLEVRSNLLYGAPRAAIDDRIDFLGIGHLLDRWPAGLSGGEAKRVAIGRALLSDPAFLLLDEPTASLDAPRRDEVLTAIEHVRDAIRLPILLVTHDLAEAERIGGRIVSIG